MSQYGYYDVSINSERFHIAGFAISGIIFGISAISCCINLCFLHRRQDPTRQGLAWVKVAWSFLTLYALLYTVAEVLDFVLRLIDYDDISFVDLGQAADQLGSLAEFFGEFTSIAVMIALVRIGVGIVSAPHPAGTKSWARFVGWASYGAAVLMGILVLSDWAVITDYTRRWYVAYSSDDVAFDSGGLGRSYTKLRTAVIILFFILALVVLGWTIFVTALAMRHPVGNSKIKKPSILLLVAAILWLLSRTFTLAAWATVYDLSDYSIKAVPNYLPLLRVILAMLPILVLLFLLFSLGLVKNYRGGLWSVDHAQPALPMQGQMVPSLQQQQQQWAPQPMYVFDPKAAGYGQQQWHYAPAQPQQQQAQVPFQAQMQSQPTTSAQNVSPAGETNARGMPISSSDDEPSAPSNRISSGQPSAAGNSHRVSAEVPDRHELSHPAGGSELPTGPRSDAPRS